MKTLGCLLSGVLFVAIVAGIDALIAIPVNWALNSFTQLHPTYMTVFVIILICSLLFGGSVKKS